MRPHEENAGHVLVTRVTLRLQVSKCSQSKQKRIYVTSLKESVCTLVCCSWCYLACRVSWLKLPSDESVGILARWVRGNCCCQWIERVSWSLLKSEQPGTASRVVGPTTKAAPLVFPGLAEKRCCRQYAAQVGSKNLVQAFGAELPLPRWGAIS